MTTKEVVQVAYNAQSVREDSWDDANNRYKLSIAEAVKQVAPPQLSPMELEVAISMNYHNWNEVQDWYHMQ